VNQSVISDQKSVIRKSVTRISLLFSGHWSLITGHGFAAACLFALVGTAAAAPAVPPAGAASCSGCHPTSAKGEARVPRLVGRNPAEIVAAMEAFRSGQKPATVMDRIAKGFSEVEIRAIADWFGAQQ
jgi:sulfide dehydrogenase cytochrome subunit